MTVTRDQPDTSIRYVDPDGPRDNTMTTVLGEFHGLLTMGEQPGDSRAEYKKRRARVVASHDVTIHDARGRDGGLGAWDFDRNGFTAVAAPEPVADFTDRGLLAQDYVPRALDVVTQAIGATRAYSVGFQIRTEETGRGTSQASYARFAHSDYGPEYEPQLRRVLAHRFGVPDEEAETCGLCLVGLWAPIDRPAYQDPLCLLDAESVDDDCLADQSIRLIYSGLSLGSMNRDRPLEERIPVPGGDAPSIAPIYSADHRWFYFPDMTPEEALVFKQYDWRTDVESHVCFHNSFRDRFHESWADCPGRRSVEVRILTTF